MVLISRRCPINVFTVEMLQEVAIEPHHSVRDVALKVQSAIASTLSIPQLSHRLIHLIDLDYFTSLVVQKL